MTGTRSFAQRLAVAGTNLLVPLHTGLILCYLGLRWLRGDELWFIDALNYVLPWILTPTLLLLPAAVYRRSRLLVILAAVPAVLFLLTYGALLLPSWPAVAGEPPFLVMTYNVRFDNRDEQAVAASIEQQSADVVVLRELEPPMAEALEERLGYLYPYSRIEPGCGLFSRLTILEYEAFRLSDEAYDFAQRLVLDVEGRRLVFFSVHPKAPRIGGFHPFGLPLGIPTGLARRGRDADVLSIIRIVEDLEGPLVVAGDFNLSDQHQPYGPLTTALVDSHRESGWGLGFTFSPFGGPGLAMWRIDLILHSRDLVALSTRLGEFGGSDHRPFVAELAFRE